MTIINNISCHSSNIHSQPNKLKLFEDANTSDTFLQILGYLSLEDIGKAAQVSRMFYNEASKRFFFFMRKEIIGNRMFYDEASNQFLFLRKGEIDRERQIERPIRYFIDNPESREQYVAFGKGIQDIYERFERELQGYIPHCQITILWTATRINALIRHLNLQNQTSPLNTLTPSQQEALENFRTIDEVMRLPDLQVRSLRFNSALKREDVWKVPDNWRDRYPNHTDQQANLLCSRHDLQPGDFLRLSDDKVFALAIRHDLQPNDLKYKSESQIFALAIRHDLQPGNISGFSNHQSETLCYRHDLQLADVEGLCYWKARMLQIRDDFSKNDIERLSKQEANILLDRYDIQRHGI